MKRQQPRVTIVSVNRPNPSLVASCVRYLAEQRMSEASAGKGGAERPERPAAAD